MLFNSYEFIFAFLPLTFFIYFYLLKKRLSVGARGFLVFASLFFYSWWNVAYLPLILGSILFNYVMGNTLSDESKNIKVGKKALLIFGIASNLALLGYFKYSDFFIANFNLVMDSSINPLHVILPLGISFFTFTQIAFLVDSYKKEVKEYDFLRYMLFVTYFPHLLAGPIIHHKDMMPQFASRWNMAIRYKNVAAGLFLFSIGLFKKVVIADTFAVWANNGFDAAVTLNMIEAWATSLSYTFQLYFDFSGYTDMAIGASLLFNIKLPINFNSPYKATSIQDFWRRWHITLSTFLRDYIYIPLGGSRKGSFRTSTNLMATFILGGIWHGAGWTFVFWGFLHGVALVINHIWKSIGLKMPTLLAWFITFNFVNIAWVFFRAKEWSDAVKILHAMFLGVIILPPELQFFNFSFISFSAAWLGNIFADKYILLQLVSVFVLTLLFKNSMEIKNSFKLNFTSLLLVTVLFVASLLNLSGVHEFLYFNF